MMMLLAVLAIAAPGGDARVAVVIGSDIGVEGDDPLEYAEQDAARFRDLLLEIGGVEASRAQLVLGSDATTVRRALAEAIGRVHELARLGPTTLIVYVSAHADAESIHLEGTTLPLDELRTTLERAPATFRLTIIDACRAPVRAVLRGGRPVPDVAISFRREAVISGAILINSAALGEPAQEWSLLRGALFSHHLMSGLRGLADADADRRITLAEAYTYAYRRTASQAVRSERGAQHPSFSIDMEGFGDWIFAEPSELGASIELGSEMHGRVLISNARGELVAEVEKRAGDTPRIALEPGRYRIIVPDGAAADAADIDLTFGGLRTVVPSDLSRTRLRRAMARGEVIVPRPWSLGAAYAISNGLAGGIAHALELELGRRIGPWFVRGHLSGSLASFDAENEIRVRDRALGIGVAAGYGFELGSLLLELGGRADAMLVYQAIDRPEEDRILANVGVEERDRSAFVPSASLLLGSKLAIVDELIAGVEARAGAAWIPMRVGARVRPLASARITLAWRF